MITSHHMEEVEYLCDRVAVLVRGPVAADGSVGALIAEHAGGAERIVVDERGGRPDRCAASWNRSATGCG